MDEAAVEDRALRLRVADAAAELARQAFLDVEVDVHQVGGARHRLGLVVHFLDVGQPLQPLLGAVEQRVRQVGTLELSHLAAQHLVVDRAGVLEVDATHVGAVARVHEEGQVDRLVLGILLRHRVDLGEGVAVRAEAQRHQFLRLGDEPPRVGLAGLDQQQAPELFLGHHHLAGDLDLAHGVDVPFVHVDRDEDVVLLRGDGHLRGLDVHVGVAAVLVVGTQLLQVALQRLARVAVVLAVPGQPVRGLQLEAVEQLVLAVGPVADDVDLADLGALALDDVDGDPHLVARHLDHVGVDLDRVLAAAEVLVGQVPGDFLQHRAVEGLALRQADVAQRALQVLGLDVLVALDLEALDRGPLEHHDDQRVAVTAQLDVAEEAGREQGLDRLLLPAGVHAVADVDRQVVVDGALGDALQPLDPDVADHEVGRLRERRHGDVREQDAAYEPA